MYELKPWRSIESFLPDSLMVEGIGWEQFLKHWNYEAFELVKRELLVLGLEQGPKGRGLRGHLEEKNVYLPAEAFRGGLAYPPKTKDDRVEAERLLETMAEVIPKIKHHRPSWPKVFEWEVLLNNGLRYPGANAEDIETIERNLGVLLPRSYREFLSISNGWLLEDQIIRPVGTVGRFDVRDPEFARAYYWGEANEVSDEDYFQYDLEKQSPIHIRVQYLPGSLLLSEHYGLGERAYLLNPAIVFDDGEWEAWSLEPGIAGARRFRSFRALMEWLYIVNIANLRKDIYELV